MNATLDNKPLTNIETGPEKLPKIEVDVYKDAVNYWGACNHSIQSKDWTTSMDPNVVEEVRGKTREEANKFLIPYLQEKHLEKTLEIERFKQFALKEFSEKFETACNKLKQVMCGYEIYRNDFTIFITTISRQPYNKENGWIWMGINNTDPIRTFLHELCHFQFIHYWQENTDSPVSKLSPEEFNYLKESLTMILDDDFFPIIRAVDRGYEAHQSFRAVLKEFWSKNKDFNALVDYALKRLPEFISKQQTK